MDAQVNAQPLNRDLGVGRGQGTVRRHGETMAARLNHVFAGGQPGPRNLQHRIAVDVLALVETLEGEGAVHPRPAHPQHRPLTQRLGARALRVKRRPDYRFERLQLVHRRARRIHQPDGHHLHRPGLRRRGRGGRLLRPTCGPRNGATQRKRQPTQNRRVCACHVSTINPVPPAATPAPACRRCTNRSGGHRHLPALAPPKAVPHRLPAVRRGDPRKCLSAPSVPLRHTSRPAPQPRGRETRPSGLNTQTVRLRF
ncbi:MAG: hypothetical protein BWZ02_02742 [Lentisphaerae bacterium ADurb.BinA184]|nr:MAG: hypothetical protein BWZ02_02742 [Lentisphaerae bacterium ADurb.BinA184]